MDTDRIIAKSRTITIIERSSEKFPRKWYIVKFYNWEFWGKYWNKSDAFQIAYFQIKTRGTK